MAFDQERGVKDLTDQMKDAVDELRRLNELLRGGTPGAATSAVGSRTTGLGGFDGA